MEHAEASNEPNIILILTDDQTVSDLSYMPITGSVLVGQGAKFNNYFVTWPLCCPSRVSILTGLYPHNHNIKDVKPPGGGFPVFRDSGLENIAIPVKLKNRGYNTAYIGKYLNSHPDGDPNYIPPGWDYWVGSASHSLPGSAYYNYKLNVNGKLVSYGESVGDYRTDVEADYAIDFIVGASRKFFLYIAPFAPHTPTIPAERHKNLFENERAPRDSSFNAIDPKNPVKYYQSREMTAEEIERVDLEHRLRLRTLQAVDEFVGRLVAKLESLGKLKSTYIVFTSDNGFHLGDHRLVYNGLYFAKNQFLEKDIKVPFVVRGPSIVPATEQNSIVANIDLYASILDMAGIDSSYEFDGRSFISLLLEDKEPLRNNVYVEIWRQNGGYLETKLLRGNRYKYVKLSNNQTLLYDIVNDPYEMNNIAEFLSAQSVKKLDDLLERYAYCKGEVCRILDQVNIDDFILAESVNTY